MPSDAAEEYGNLRGGTIGACCMVAIAAVIVLLLTRWHDWTGIAVGLTVIAVIVHLGLRSIVGVAIGDEQMQIATAFARTAVPWSDVTLVSTSFGLVGIKIRGRRLPFNLSRRPYFLTCYSELSDILHKKTCTPRL